MKQHIYINEGHPRLTLLFAGWGSDPALYAHYRPAASDYRVCYDYRTLALDPATLQGYESIRVVAWSLGVWAAGACLQTRPAGLAEAVALNGTPFPAHDTMGIPCAVFDGTRAGLTPQSLQKFYRRMCGTAPAWEAFRERLPRRDAGELADELGAIRRQAAHHPAAGEAFGWDRVVVSLSDRIIPPANQLAAWQGHPGLVTTDEPHYSDNLLKQLIEAYE